jgi:TfoX/Sxy family transcriptional regulator of competence genes
MATQLETIEFILARLRDRGNFTARAMFGEYALYADGKVVGLVCDNLLYVKIVPASEALESLCLKDNPYPGARPHYLVKESQISTIHNLAHILSNIARTVPANKKKSGKTKIARRSKSRKT